MQLLHILQLLVLMTLANGTPIVAKKIFGPRFSFPLDAGTIFFDGRPLFGPSKTIRGILISVLITTASAPLIGLDLTIGAIVAGAAMAGDLFSSFVKRRLNFPPSSQALGLDQVPESLFECRNPTNRASWFRVSSGWIQAIKGHARNSGWNCRSCLS